MLVDEVSLQQFALLRDLRHQLGLAELLNEPERIKTVELRMGIGKRLPLAHNEALRGASPRFEKDFPKNKARRRSPWRSWLPLTEILPT